MRQIDVEFNKRTLNLMPLLAGGNPEFTDSIAQVKLIGIKNAAGEMLETSHIGFKGYGAADWQLQATGFTKDVGPFHIRVDKQSGTLSLHGDSFQEMTAVIGVNTKNLNRR